MKLLPITTLASRMVGKQAALSSRAPIISRLSKTTYMTTWALGCGLDIDNHNTLYEGNTVVNNNAEGIKHEISFSANIRDNVVSGNGRALSVWLWGSQILIQNSSGAEVSHNMIIVPQAMGMG